MTNSDFSTPEMNAVWSPQSQVRRMLEFEAALAHALARAGVIPSAAADEIGAACQYEWDDAVDDLYSAAVEAGTPAIPLMEMLTESCRSRREALSTGELPVRIPWIRRWFSRCRMESIC